MNEALKLLKTTEGVKVALRRAGIDPKNIDTLDNFEWDNWKIDVRNLIGEPFNDTLAIVTKKIAEVVFPDRETTTSEKDRCEVVALALIHRAVEPEVFKVKEGMEM